MAMQIKPRIAQRTLGFWSRNLDPEPRKGSSGGGDTSLGARSVAAFAFYNASGLSRDSSFFSD
jgi:hypothetical protein